MPVTVAGTYTTYSLSLWRWVSASLILKDTQVRDRIDDELETILEEAGLVRAPTGETPDLLLRYEAAPGVLVAELIDSRTNDSVWRTDMRGDRKAEELRPIGTAWRV
jgi:hypothetical protein